ncbi:uncharacterized protein LOC144743400 [Ciona intestinalis]
MGNQTGQVEYDFNCMSVVFCTTNFTTECENVTLKACPVCNMRYAAIFITLVLILGFMIVVGNVIIIISTRTLKRQSKVDVIRTSLAGADVLSGLNIFTVVVYHFAKTLNWTAAELVQYQASVVNTAPAVIGAVVFVFTVTSSLYHLLLLSCERLYAIQWPISYKLQSRSSLHRVLIGVWIISALTASVPGWFPKRFAFNYYSLIFVYYPSINQDAFVKQYGSVLSLLVIFIVLPFALTMVMLFVTLCIGHRHFKRSERLANQDRCRSIKKELSMVVHMILMMLGFSATIIPLVSFSIAYFTLKLGCGKIKVPYATCFYLGLGNSLVNVVVYSLLDKDFRQSVKNTCKRYRRLYVLRST